MRLVSGLRACLTGLAVIALLGCATGGKSPTSPTAGQQATQAVSPLIPAGGGSAASYNSLAGIYSLDLTLGASPSATLEPLRLAAAKGDNYAVDVTNFMRVSPCHDCLKVVGLSYGANPGTLAVDFALKHPFALPTPPYASNARLDLHAFDVMGFLLRDSTSPLNFGNGDTAAPYFLIDAEGYSNLYDAATETAFPTPSVSEHPYKLFFEDPTAGNFDGTNVTGFTDLTAPTGQNVMAMGSNYSIVRYTLAIAPASQLHFGFAVGLSWGQSAQGRGSNLGQRLQPVYYLPEYHHKAPWTVTATVLSDNFQGGQTTSSANLEIHLRDWQLGATVASPFTFPDTPRDQVAQASELTSLTVYAPGILTTPKVIDLSSGTGTGVYDDKVFTTILTNAAGAAAGTYYAWVKAIDSRAPGPNEVIDRNINFSSISDFHTGTLVPLVVAPYVPPNTPPTAALSPNPVALNCMNPVVTLDASGSTDAETPTSLSYEFDLDLVGGNPSNFTVDVGPVTNPVLSHVITTNPAPSYLAVRVTDPGLLQSIAVVPVNYNPVNLGSSVSISPLSGSYVQQFPYAVESGGPVMARNGNYIYFASNTWQSGNAGATSQIRLWRTSNQGTSWLTMTTLNLANPYGANFSDYAIAAGSDGRVWAIYDPQVGPDYNNNWNTKISVVDNNGTGTWTTMMTEVAAGQRVRSNIYVDPNNPNLVVAFDVIQNFNAQRFHRSTTGLAGSFTTTGTSGIPSYGMGFHKLPSGNILILGSTGGVIQARSSSDQGATWPIIGSLAQSAGAWHGGGGAVADNGNNMAFGYKAEGVEGVSVAASSNGGVTWAPAASGIEDPANLLTATNSWAMIDLAYDGGGGLYLEWFHAYWGPPNVNKGYLVFSTNNGTSFSSPVVLYDCVSSPSWPGMAILSTQDNCTMLSAFSRLQNLESRTI